MHLGAEWTDVLQAGIQTAGQVFGAPAPSYQTPVFTAPTTSGTQYPVPTMQQQIDSLFGIRAPAVAAPSFTPYQPGGGSALGLNSGLLVAGGLALLVVLMMRRRR